MRPLQLSCTAPRCSVRSIYTRGVHGVVCLLCSVGAPPAALERSSVKNSLNAAAGTASPLPESPAEQPPAPRPGALRLAVTHVCSQGQLRQRRRKRACACGAPQPAPAQRSTVACLRSPKCTCRAFLGAAWSTCRCMLRCCGQGCRHFSEVLFSRRL